MGKRGPKTRSPELAAMSGETRPSRQIAVLFPDHSSRPDPEVIEPPKWLGRAARALWVEKLNKYRQRGQKIQGFEHALAQYCHAEAEIINLRKGPVPVALRNAVRAWAAEFYDTPSSMNVKVGGKGKDANPYEGIGKKPTDD